MTRLLLAPLIIALGLPVQADQTSLEEKAIDLVIEKHDKRLKKSLEGEVPKEVFGI